jgi:hypothetical protein
VCEVITVQGTSRLVVTVLGVAFLGCGSTTAQQAPPDLAMPDLSPTVAEVSGSISDFQGAKPITGVSITVLDHPEIPAVMNDATGQYVIPNVPIGSDIFLRFDKDKYVPLVTRQMHVGGPAARFETLFMVTTDTANLLSQVLGVPLDPAKGFVTVSFLEAGTNHYLAGAQVHLDPQTGMAPVYWNESGYPDTSLTASTTGGSAVFVNYEPTAAGATSTLTITHPTFTSCRGRSTPDHPYPFKVRIFPGVHTNTGAAECSMGPDAGM